MKGLRVAIGADHAGFDLMLHVRDFLHSHFVKVIECGPLGYDLEDDYPDFAHRVAEMVSVGGVDFGFLHCGTGQGMAITANKWKGVRAVTVRDELEAEMVRKHNNANVFCLGAKIIKQEGVWEVVRTCLTTSFEKGRHERRVGKIEAGSPYFNK